MSNYFAEKKGKSGGGWIGKERSGTLYCPSIHSEVSILSQIRSRRRSAFVTAASDSLPLITTSSATAIEMSSDCVDYIFTDPPFGSNKMYSELNFLWESWLKVKTNNKQEALVNRTQRKGVPEYESLMRKGFAEYYRILKPGRWITIEFSNTNASVWNALQNALGQSGFVVADVRTLDKQQGSILGYTTSTAARLDLAITAYKPDLELEQGFHLEAGTEDGVWRFVRSHLSQVPVVSISNGKCEVVTERLAYALFDKTVAFHVQRGIAVPLSATEFNSGLTNRYVCRDGMYFLPEQVGEYDKQRLASEEIMQPALFVTDEKSAIVWLRVQLSAGSLPFQDIQPRFLQELHQARHEDLPDLRVLLDQNFLQDGEGRWYLPDPNKAEDLEKLRQRDLLREFERYTQSRGRLKTFRTEAVRAGFAHAYHERNYGLIVQIAERLPEAVLQEDPDLLMYYDNASLRG